MSSGEWNFPIYKLKGRYLPFSKYVQLKRVLELKVLFFGGDSVLGILHWHIKKLVCNSIFFPFYHSVPVFAVLDHCQQAPLYFPVTLNFGPLLFFITSPISSYITI